MAFGGIDGSRQVALPLGVVLALAVFAEFEHSGRLLCGLRWRLELAFARRRSSGNATVCG